MIHKIDYLEYTKHWDFTKRIDSYGYLIEKFGRTSIQSEEWELIKLNQNVESFEEEDKYILLHLERKTNLFTDDEFKIKIIPLNYLKKDYKYSSEVKVWGIKVNFLQGNIKFAYCGDFEIKPEKLRDKGLGSYLLSKLVKIAKEYPPEFKIGLHVKSIDDEFPNNEKLVDSLYKKFNLIDAKTILEVKEINNMNKIDELPLITIVPNTIKKNIHLKYLIDKNKDSMKELKLANFNYKKQNRTLMLIIVVITVFLLVDIIILK